MEIILHVYRRAIGGQAAWTKKQAPGRSRKNGQEGDRGRINFRGWRRRRREKAWKLGGGKSKKNSRAPEVCGFVPGSQPHRGGGGQHKKKSGSSEQRIGGGHWNPGVTGGGPRQERIENRKKMNVGRCLGGNRTCSLQGIGRILLDWIEESGRQEDYKREKVEKHEGSNPDIGAEPKRLIAWEVLGSSN